LDKTTPSQISELSQFSKKSPKEKCQKHSWDVLNSKKVLPSISFSQSAPSIPFHP
jgi:hypothetical protein